MSNSETDLGLPEGPFIGRESFRAAVRQALAEAARAGWRELIVCDASFFDWPLGERAVVQALDAWARGAGQRFTVLAQRYDAVERLHPLFVGWRRQWAHKIECRSVRVADPLELPSALWSPGWALQRLDALRSGGVSGAQPERVLHLRESLSAWLERSSPAFAATTLGL